MKKNHPEQVHTHEETCFYLGCSNKSTYITKSVSFAIEKKGNLVCIVRTEN